MRASPTAVLALILSSPAVADEKSPVRYESAEGGYRVRFPGAPKVETSRAKGERPAQAMAAFADETATRLYVAAVTVFPPGNGKTPGLDAAVDLAVGGWRMKTTEVKKFEFGVGKLPARDVRARADDGTTVSRSYFIFDAEARRLYIVYASSEKDAGTGTFADAFLDSFELLPRK